jgi:hypothetical protein
MVEHRYRATLEDIQKALEQLITPADVAPVKETAQFPTFVTPAGFRNLSFHVASTIKRRQEGSTY